MVALEAIRNLIAHRAGLVDDEFLRRTGRSDTRGDALFLNAEDVTRYVGRVADAGGDVVVFVDEWLRAHGEEEEAAT